jgi:hypothetical protein
MNAALSQLERDVTRILERIRQLEEIDVPSAAKLIKKPQKWVRANLPLIIHGPRSSHVRLVDIEAYQARRTLRPSLNGRKAR